MFLSEIAVRRPVFTTMVVMALVIFGFIGFRELPLDMMPEVDFPYVTVTIVYRGASPETVEGEIINILEDDLGSLEGIKSLQSWSMESTGFIFLEFELEYEIDQVVQDVRDKVSAALIRLPEDIEPPIVEKLDVNAQPIMSYVVSADMPPAELAQFIEDRIKVPIQTVGGVGRVNVLGTREREVKIWLDLDKMKSLDVSVDEVSQTLRSKNVDIPGGRIETGKREYSVKTTGEVKSVREFGNLVIRYLNGRPIRIDDIARVEDGIEDRRSVARLNGVNAIGVTIVQQSGSNIVEVAAGVKEEVAALRAQLPDGIEIIETVDQSVFIQDSMDDMIQQIFLGGLIATLIVLIFLRNLRTTLIAAVSIPTSIMATFFFMNLAGFTLNMVSLMALALSVGMLIDDAIVVLENVYRHIDMGKPLVQATLEATREVGLAVLATSMSMFAVFIPIAFMKGIIGRFMLQFGLSVAFAVGVSLFTAFTLIPMLSSQFMKKQETAGTLFQRMESFFLRMDENYRRMLRWALGHRWLTLGIATAMFIGAMMLGPLIGAEFQPAFDQGKISVGLEAELGSDIDVTEAYVERVEKIIDTYPEVQIIFSTIGGGSGDVNKATIFVGLSERTERKRTHIEIMAALRADLTGIPGLKTSVSEYGDEGGGGGQEIQYILTGSDIGQLQRIADGITNEMRKTPGFVDIDTDFSAGRPEVRVSIDRDKADDLGVDVMSIATTINSLVSGDLPVTKYKEGGELYDVKLRLAKEYRNQPDDLLRLFTRGGGGSKFELASLASIETATGPSQINHYGKQREITVLANIEDIPLGTGVEIVEGIAADKMEPGVKAIWSGMADIMTESFGYLGFALVLAIILIYMILASQFEHFVHPFTIMFSLPLAMIGAFPLMLLLGRTLNIMSFIGLITLMGLVTKNAILLVDFTIQTRAKGKSTREALLIAGPIRLRPILMTALSTMGGMIPALLALGAGGEFRAPMATAVIGGLISSTFLTLLVVPAVYSLFDDAFEWFYRVILRRKKPEEDATGAAF